MKERLGQKEKFEADFIAGYCMTHKRGATYNWKHIELSFNLFFQISDCAYTDPGHQGTLAQQMAAACLGYELNPSSAETMAYFELTRSA